LLVAAERFELPKLPQASAVPHGYVSERNGMRWILVANGPGPKLAGIAADEFKGQVDALVSIGLCGGLDPDLQIGDIFVATSVNGRPIELPRTARSYRSGSLISEDRVAVTVEDKRRLRAAGAAAVEMEAGAICNRAVDLEGTVLLCARRLRWRRGCICDRPERGPRSERPVQQSAHRE
jgi:Nucleoside phosphorylase